MGTASAVDRVGATKFTTAPDREIVATMDTFLPPIEQLLGLFMKLAYYFTRRQFGKVLTPLKVHSARLPPAFGLFYTKIGKLDKKLLPPPETVLLIREQVARTDVEVRGAFPRAPCVCRRRSSQERSCTVASTWLRWKRTSAG